jgi:alpha-ketoglutarate-dependent taurine dioxygenase
VLYAVIPAKTGGDTFVNMHQAYNALPKAMKKRIDGLQARHVYQSKHRKRQLPNLQDASGR